MSTSQGSWIWYELVTPNPPAAKDFYGSVVGWTLSGGQPEHNGYGFIANPDGGLTGGVLPLTEGMAKEGMRPCWLGYIGVDDCDASVRAIAARGGTCLMPPRDIPMAGRIAMVADPNGAPFYIMTPKPPAGAPQQSTAFSPTSLGRCAWNELLATDQAKALAFYTELFGWSLPAPMDMGAMGSYQFIAHGGEQVGAIMRTPGQITGSFWNHYFRVPLINTAVTAITANGGQIVNGPMPVPGDDYIVQATDPQGVFFCLVGRQ